jgi:hypothetical protein
MKGKIVMKKNNIDKNLLADKIAQWLIQNTSGDQQYLAGDIRNSLDDDVISGILGEPHDEAVRERV